MNFLRKYWILIAILIIKFLLSYLLVNQAYELHRDEFLHLDQGRHLAWGYISVPPVTSWVSRIIQLLGNGVFWVKFFPALFGSLTIVLVWKIIEELKGGWFALLLGSLGVLLSPLLRINILFQPNSLDILFWTLVYFTIIKYINTQQTKWLWATWLAIAFGILSKYNMVFLLAGLFPALIFSQHRKDFTNKNFALGMLLAALIVLPNILWQINNDFPTLYQLKELSETQLIHVKRSAFVKDQFLFFINSLFIIIAAFVGFFIFKPFKKFRFIFWSFFITILLFTVLKAKSYYSIGLYPVLIGFGAVYLEYLFNDKNRYYLKAIALMLVIVLSLPFLLIAFPTQAPERIKKTLLKEKAGTFRWEDGREHNIPQDFADMLGWKELAKVVDSVYTTLPDKTTVMVFCSNYGEAGAVNYYSKNQNISAVTFNADYINWINLKEPIHHLILIAEAGDEGAVEKFKGLFESSRLAGMVTNKNAREYGTKIFVFQNAQKPINNVMKDALNFYKKGE